MRKIEQILVLYDDGSATRFRSHGRHGWSSHSTDRHMQSMGAILEVTADDVAADVARVLELACSIHPTATTVTRTCSCEREIDR